MQPGLKLRAHKPVLLAVQVYTALQLGTQLHLSLAILDLVCALAGLVVITATLDSHTVIKNSTVLAMTVDRSDCASARPDSDVLPCTMVQQYGLAN